MTLLTTIVIVLAYASLLVELVFFPVPSVASTYQLVYKPQLSSSGAEFKGELNSVRSWPILKKIMLLFLPAIINISLFVLPLLFLIFPALLKQSGSLFQLPASGLWLALLLILAGRVLTFASVLKIRKQNSQQGSNFRLHANSFFAHSRNPGLIGMYLMIIGLALIFPSVYLCAGIVFYIGYMHFKVLLEEDFLASHFGENYLNYKSKTKRYL